MQIYANTLYPDSSHPFSFNFFNGLTAVKVMLVLQRKCNTQIDEEIMGKFGAGILSSHL